MDLLIRFLDLILAIFLSRQSIRKTFGSKKA